MFGLLSCKRANPSVPDYIAAPVKKSAQARMYRPSSVIGLTIVGWLREFKFSLPSQGYWTGLALNVFS